MMKWLVICAIGLLPGIVGGQDLQWEELPALPASAGLGGPIVGTCGEVLIVAGGANFPGGPPWPTGNLPAGRKVWHDQIYAIEPGEAGWTLAGQLPWSLAYAAAISTDEGVFVLGGETFGEDPSSETGRPANFASDRVLRLSWNASTRSVEVDVDALPPLPQPCRYHNAVQIGSVIYVTASWPRDASSGRLDEKGFWSLDLAVPPQERQWTSLSPWPGAPREKMMLAVQRGGADPRYASPVGIYLFGGANWFRNPEGIFELNRYQYFSDGWRYLPQTGEWTRVADLPPVSESGEIWPAGKVFDSQQNAWVTRTATESPIGSPAPPAWENQPRPLAAASILPMGGAHILLFSGDSGRYVTLDPQERPPFPKDVLAYHTITDTWTVAGQMPTGVVTTSAVRWNGRMVLPTGETRPGIRTPAVQSATFSTSENRFGAFNTGVLIGYLVVLVGIGFFFAGREKGTDDYFLGGRRVPWWAAGLSIYATQLSAITFVSLPAVAYATNWVIYPAQWTIFLFTPVVVIFYLPFFRRLNVTTAYEYLERRFHLAVRVWGSLSFVAFQLGRMAIVVYLPALALSTVTGIDVWVCIITMGALATLYTFLGGIEAVIWTDVVQVVVLWGGMLLSIVLITWDLGGPSEIMKVARIDQKLTLFHWSWDTTHMATWLILLGNLTLQFAPYTTDQAVIQRYLTTADEAGAARGIWLNGLLVLPFSFLFFALGTCLYVYFKAHPELLLVGMENDAVFPLFMAEQLPVGISGLVIAGVFAASMSSLDSSIHSIATTLTNDFYRRFFFAASDRQCLRVARRWTLAMGCLGTTAALILATYDIQSLFFLFQQLLGLLGSGLVGIFILGIFTRRATALGVLVGAAASTLLLYWVTFHTTINFFLYSAIGIATAVGVGYLVSLATGPPANDLSGLTWFTRNRQRREGDHVSH